jgi:spore coat polysaccharide biosynthesis protein SpsF
MINSNIPKILIILQARTSSSRLPNKVLKNFWNGKSVLEILIDELKEFFLDIPLVVATTINSADSRIVDLAESKNVIVYRGSENNVLSRFVDIIESLDYTHVIRVCSDNPFLNMSSIKNLIDQLVDLDIDYLSYVNTDGTPVIKTHYGLFAEIVSSRALIISNKMQNEPIYQEHVTNYIYGNPEIFNVKYLQLPKCLYGRNDIRFTLDDDMDFDNLTQLYRNTLEFKDSIESLINYIDINTTYKDIMITNIKKYTK